jgi:hypothetical protein
MLWPSRPPQNLHPPPLREHTVVAFPSIRVLEIHEDCSYPFHSQHVCLRL